MFKLPDYKITKLLNPKRNHGKHSNADQRRTQKIETRRAQEEQGGEAKEAPRLRSRIEKAQGEEAGPRPVETVKQQLAVSPWHLAGKFPTNWNLIWLNAKG
jgi:hypothetical protein